jgi:hypothetical protein
VLQAVRLDRSGSWAAAGFEDTELGVNEMSLDEIERVVI